MLPKNVIIIYIIVTNIIIIDIIITIIMIVIILIVNTITKEHPKCQRTKDRSIKSKNKTSLSVLTSIEHRYQWTRQSLKCEVK